MAHEDLQKQYDKDVEQLGEYAYTMWEISSTGADDDWEALTTSPSWFSSLRYRRKEPSFVPEYFSGLNWREAERLIGKIVEFSDNADHWTEPMALDKLRYFEVENPTRVVSRFVSQENWWYYIRTCSRTHAHPTITINGVKLPRPEVEAPAIGTRCWVFDPTENEVDTFFWSRRDRFMTACLEQGTLHLTEDRAQAWADWWNETVVKAVKGDK